MVRLREELVAQGVRAVLEAIAGQRIQTSLPRHTLQCETQWGNFHGFDAAAAAAAARCSGVQANGGGGRVVVVVVVAAAATTTVVIVVVVVVATVVVVVVVVVVVAAAVAGAVTAHVFNLEVVAP